MGCIYTIGKSLQFIGWNVSVVNTLTLQGVPYGYGGFLRASLKKKLRGKCL